MTIPTAEVREAFETHERTLWEGKGYQLESMAPFFQTGPEGVYLNPTIGLRFSAFLAGATWTLCRLKKGKS